MAGADGSDGEGDSIAAQKGDNWALRKGRDRTVAFARTIRVSCQADRLVILPERASRQRVRSVEVPGPLRDRIEAFVAELHDHIDSWGLALPGGYWKPTLSVEIAPGGERRYEELARLLEGSGITVERSLR